MAYCGLANKRLVEALRARGADAVGLSAMDGGIATGRRKPDLRIVEGDRPRVLHDNHAGTIERVDPSLLRLLLDAGRLPVLTPPAISDRGEAINVDGDRLAAEVAVALGAQRLVILMNVPGLLRDPADEASLIPRLDPGAIDAHLPLARGRARVKLLAAGGRSRAGCPPWSSATGAASIARCPGPWRAAAPGSPLRSIVRSLPEPGGCRIAGCEPTHGSSPWRLLTSPPPIPTPAGVPARTLGCAVTAVALRVLQLVDAAAFLLIGLLALRDWWRGRERRRGYLAIALGCLGLVALGVGAGARDRARGPPRRRPARPLRGLRGRARPLPALRAPAADLGALAGDRRPGGRDRLQLRGGPARRRPSRCRPDRPPVGGAGHRARGLVPCGGGARLPAGPHVRRPPRDPAGPDALHRRRLRGDHGGGRPLPGGLHDRRGPPRRRPAGLCPALRPAAVRGIRAAPMVAPHLAPSRAGPAPPRHPRPPPLQPRSGDPGRPRPRLGDPAGGRRRRADRGRG